MKTRLELFKRNWIYIFFIVVIELSEETVSTLFHINGKFDSLLEMVFILLQLGIIYLMLKGIGKTSLELQTSRQRLKNIFDTLDVAIWSHDLKSNTLLITSGIEKLYGYSSEDFYQDTELWKKVIHPDDFHVLANREQKLLLGQAATSVYRIIRPDGEVRWIQDRGIPKLDQNGQFVDFNSVLFDITDRKESEDRYRSLVEMSPDFIAVFSRGRIDYINEAGCKLIGAQSPEKLMGKPISKFIPTSILNQIRDMELSIYDDRNEVNQFEFEMIQLDGNTMEVEMTTMPILYEGRVAKQIVVRDITQRKKDERTIEYMAYYDALTRLPNRNMFRQHLNDALNLQEKRMLAVLFLDLDRFKIINDTKGHTIGDKLLVRVARRLERAIQDLGLVSRYGGDEFIIFLDDVESKRDVITVAQRILDEFSNPLQLNNQDFYVTPSIGISLYPTDGEDEETLIKLADIAMYVAKEHGKNNFQFYSSQLNGLSSRKMELENGLRKAVELKQLELYYQPQIEIATGKIVGIEALIRWHHPEYGLVPPNEFIPLAEETGLIVSIGKWILQEACKQNKIWHKNGLVNVPIAVNISVRQLQDDQFVEAVTKILKEVGLESKYLELEITESIMQNIEQSSIILNNLKKVGVQISIDDFGTGYSSLSYLRHLPIDKIKIDKSFVDDIIYHNNQGSIVKTIIDMGLNLNFTVIAEGIETEEQVQFLLKHSCKIGQGYYYSRPLTAKNIEEMLIKANT